LSQYHHAILQYGDVILQYGDAILEYGSAILEYGSAILEYHNAIPDKYWSIKARRRADTGVSKHDTELILEYQSPKLS